jgi:hypothetical protein
MIIPEAVRKEKKVEDVFKMGIFYINQKID